MALHHITSHYRYGKQSEDIGFITLLLKSGVPLKNVGVGADCALDPSLKCNTYGNPAKYILLITTHTVLEKFVQQVRHLPSHSNVLSAVCDVSLSSMKIQSAYSAVISRYNGH